MEDTVKGIQSVSPLSRMLVEEGHIGSEDIPRIEEYANKKKLRFGEAALALKLIPKSTLERAVALQFDYPVLDRKTTGYSKELIAAYKPFTPRGEAIRKLRSRLLLLWHHNQQRALAVVSPTDKHSASWVAANLAITFSQLGHKTLLIDANLRRPVLGDWFCSKQQEGLSSLLVSRTNFESVRQCLPGFRDLTLLPAGTAPPIPNEVLARKELWSLFAYVRSKFDVTIVDTPAFTDDDGASAIASACGSAMIVAKKNQTMFAETRKLIQALGRDGASIVGSVLLGS